MSKTLIQTNPHLKDPDKRRAAILRSVATSSAVEGIRLTPEEWQELTERVVKVSKHFPL